jgi:hypothetical protein
MRVSSASAATSAPGSAEATYGGAALETDSASIIEWPGTLARATSDGVAIADRPAARLAHTIGSRNRMT